MITKLSRRAAVFAGAMATMAMLAGPASASRQTQDYVKENAQAVLNSLAQTSSATQRRAQFASLMDKFADMPRVADFVLGRYARPARADAALYKEWVAAFREYGLAVYETELDQYRGSTIVVSGSKDFDVNGTKRSLVSTSIPQANGRPLLVDWDLQLYPDGRWRVVDAYLKFTPEAVASLAVQQREDFVSRLGKNGGNVRQLLNEVKAETASKQASIKR